MKIVLVFRWRAPRLLIAFCRCFASHPRGLKPTKKWMWGFQLQSQRPYDTGLTYIYIYLKQCFRHESWRRPPGRPRTCWRDHISWYPPGGVSGREAHGLPRSDCQPSDTLEERDEAMCSFYCGLAGMSPVNKVMKGQSSVSPSLLKIHSNSPI